MSPTRSLSLMLTAAVMVAGLIAASPGAMAGSPVVWLTLDSDGPKSVGKVRLPLEWLAALDRDGKTNIKVEDTRVDCQDLWTRYRDLPAGETREVRRGIDKDLDHYVIHVASEERSPERALGKVHILTEDRRGKGVDIRFPLDLPKLLTTVASSIAGFFGGDTTRIDVSSVSICGPAELRKLADYGPFLAIDTTDSDSSSVQIQIE